MYRWVPWSVFYVTWNKYIPNFLQFIKGIKLDGSYKNILFKSLFFLQNGGHLNKRSFSPVFLNFMRHQRNNQWKLYVFFSINDDISFFLNERDRSNSSRKISSTILKKNIVSRRFRDGFFPQFFQTHFRHGFETQ